MELDYDIVLIDVDSIEYFENYDIAQSDNLFSPLLIDQHSSILSRLLFHHDFYLVFLNGMMPPIIDAIQRHLLLTAMLLTSTPLLVTAVDCNA